MVRGRQVAATGSAVLLGLAAGAVVGVTTLAPAAPSAAPASAGLLREQQVLLVVADGISVREASSRVRSAQGVVTGQVLLSRELLAEDGRSTVDQVVAGTAPQSLRLPGAGLERAGALLGAALDDGLTATQQEAVLGGFAGADLVEVAEAPTTRPGTVLLVGAGADRSALDELARGLRSRSWNVLTSTQ